MAKPLEGLELAKPDLHEKLSKVASGFMTKDNGPFKCGRCDFFSAPGNCELVEGKIDSEDCCNLFKPKD